MPRSGQAEAVRVEGLADFIRELKALGNGLPRELGRANKEAATLVADAAESRARALGGVAAKSAPSIRAAAMQRNAAVNLGSASAPWALGAEFGALRWHQFQSWRGNQWNPDSGGVGYFLHPAVRETRDEFLDVYGRILDELARKAFPS